MGFYRQEYWSGLPFPSPEDLPDPGIKPQSPTLWEVSLPPEPPGKPFHDLAYSNIWLKRFFFPFNQIEATEHYSLIITHLTIGIVFSL